MRVDKHCDAGRYFVMSYGECMVATFFNECVDMIVRHKNWTCVLHKFMLDPPLLNHSCYDGAYLLLQAGSLGVP